MDGALLQDRLCRAMGAAARITGASYDLFRPNGAALPLAPGNRRMRMPVTLDGGDPGYRRPRGYERALRATFDSISTRPGDYLVGPRGVLFVAALPALLRPLCVLTTSTLDVLRPDGGSVPGLNDYGGAGVAGVQPVLTGWPGQVLAEGAGPAGGLPADGGLANWSVLLPVTPVEILGSDVLQDESGRRFVVRLAEGTEFGWRLLARQSGV